MGSPLGLEPCYADAAKAYRQQMAGSFEATSLPAPANRAEPYWGKVATVLDEISHQIESAINKAEAAHQGAAADAGQRAMADVRPLIDSARVTAQGVQKQIGPAVGQMNNTFQSLPAPGQKLANGQDAIFDHPQKTWKDAPVVNLVFGDYDDKMSAYQATNQQAEQVMNAYQGRSQATIAQTPQFQSPPPPPGSNQPAPGTGMGNANSALAGSHGSGSSMHSGGGAAGAGSHLAGGAGGGSAHGWNPGGAAGTGAQGFGGGAAGAGAGDALGGAGSAGPGFAGDLGIAGAGAGVGGAAGMASRGGAGVGRGFGGAARGGASAGGAKGGPGAGGRAGVGAGGGNAAENAGAGARGANAAGGRGAMGGPMSGARGGQGQGGEEQEHTRPSWLIETDDVFGDGVPRVAPPVLGE